MSAAAGLPAWYWERGLHDAQLLSAEISLQTLSRPNKTANTALTVIFSAAIVTRTNS